MQPDGYIVALPAGTMPRHHLFRRPGEWSLCGLKSWLECRPIHDVTKHTWICADCKAEAAKETA